jgi:hypothetical protein
MPHTDNPYSPKRTKLRNAIELPSVTQSRTLMLLPKRNIPNELTADPNRPKLRKLIELPK